MLHRQRTVHLPFLGEGLAESGINILRLLVQQGAETAVTCNMDFLPGSRVVVPLEALVPGPFQIHAVIQFPATSQTVLLSGKHFPAVNCLPVLRPEVPVRPFEGALQQLVGGLAVVRIFRTDGKPERSPVIGPHIVQLLVPVDPGGGNLCTGRAQIRSRLPEVPVIHQAGTVILTEEIIGTPADLMRLAAGVHQIVFNNIVNTSIAEPVPGLQGIIVVRLRKVIGVDQIRRELSFGIEQGAPPLSATGILVRILPVNLALQFASVLGVMV